MRHLEAIGFPASSFVLALSDADFNSQDRVDMKRISVILNQLQIRLTAAPRPSVSTQLRRRLASLDGSGVALSDECEAVSIPSSLNLVVRHDDVDLFEEIGAGQTGEVLRGVVKSTRESVAVKILHPPIELDRFRREVSTIAVLRHPSLLRFCGYTNEDPYYILTEYMENGSLYDFLGANPRGLSMTERTLIAQDVARGMEYLHGRGIIHRDLKSSNILLDGRRRGRICDFGLIRMKTRNPMTGLVGTSHWMAPEVLLSSPFYDEKVDVFSFEIVLWELLTSRRPYEYEQSQVALIVNVTQKHVRPVIPDSCPAGLRALIEQCWQADARLRPSFHEIVVKLSRPDCQFPGCELLVVIRESGCRGRHNYASSTPIGASIASVRAPQHCVGATTEGFCRAIRRNSDAMALGHMEHFAASVMQMRQLGQSPNIDFGKAMPELIGLVANAQPRFRCRIIQVVFDVLCQRKAIEFFDTSLIPLWLRSDDENIVGTVQTNIARNPDPAFFTKDTIEALLVYAAHPEQEIRVRAFAPLLSAMSCPSAIFLEELGFVYQVLSFTMRKLPPGMLKGLLDNLEKILGRVSSISDGVVVRLVRMQTIVPGGFQETLSRCIKLVLNFDNVKPYYSQIWQNAVRHIDSCQCLFVHFLDQLPVNALEGVAILMGATTGTDSAVAILVRFAWLFQEVRRFCLMFLPTKNQNLELLASFYEQLLDFPEVLGFAEFYECAQYLCRSDKLPDLFNSDKFDPKLFQESRVCRRMVELLESQECQAAILKMVLDIELRYDVPRFRRDSHRFFRLLGNESLREDAFLVLAAMAKYGLEGIDCRSLRRAAQEFSERPGRGMEAAGQLALGKESSDDSGEEESSTE
jgi:serine/threonine protein kinase